MIDKIIEIWERTEEKLPGFRIFTAVFLILVVLGYAVIKYKGVDYWWIVIPGFFLILMFGLFLWLVLAIITVPNDLGPDARWMRAFLLRFVLFLFVGFILSGIGLTASLAVFHAPTAVWYECCGSPSVPVPDEHSIALAHYIFRSNLPSVTDRANEQSLLSSATAMDAFLSTWACPYCGQHHFADVCQPEYTSESCTETVRITRAADATVRLSRPIAVVAPKLKIASDVGSCASKRLSKAGMPDRILGVDVAHIEHDVDFGSLAAKGINFVFLKSSQGAGFVDPAFVERWKAAGEAGFIRGAYHVFTAADPAEQAALFLNVLSRVQFGPCDLGPALDLDSVRLPPGTDPAKFAASALTWLANVKAGMSKSLPDGSSPTPFVYLTSFDFATKLASARALAGYPLWIASFNVLGTPSIPGAWQNYTFWEFTDGKSGNVVDGVPYDVNQFNGTPDQLFGLTR